jgi:hypothetical protein
MGPTQWRPEAPKSRAPAQHGDSIKKTKCDIEKLRAAHVIYLWLPYNTVRKRVTAAFIGECVWDKNGRPQNQWIISGVRAVDVAPAD